MILNSLSSSMDDESSRFSRVLSLFFIGFFMIFAGVMILMVAVLLSGGSADFGAVVFIGPFPIVVGVGPRAEWVTLFAIILGFLSMVLFFLFRGEVRRVKSQS